MGDTIEQSVTSILDQVSDEYEVLVIDGGSSDRSVDVLQSLSQRYPNFRYVALEDDPKRRLGRDRQISIERAQGDEVIFQVDCDDVYDPAIPDLVEVYNQIRDGVNFDFLLKGCAISMAPRDLLLEAGGFRNVGRREDRDLWRRLFNQDAVIWLDHIPFWKSIGYDEEDFISQFKKVFDEIATDLQVGLSASSSAKWLLRKGKVNRWAYIQLAMLPLAYISAQSREQYSTPPEYRDPEALFERISKERMTFEELAAYHGFDIKKSALSQLGQEIFFPDKTGYNYRGVGVDLVEAAD